MSKCFTENQISLLADMETVGKRLSLSEFFNRFPILPGQEISTVNKYLYCCFVAKDNRGLWWATALEHEVGRNEETLRLYCELLTEEWHTCHEMIVSIFDSYKYYGCLDRILRAMELNFPHHQSDENHAFEKRCVWLFYKANTEQSRNYLKQIVKWPIKDIAKLARERLKAIREE